MAPFAMSMCQPSLCALVALVRLIHPLRMLIIIIMIIMIGAHIPLAAAVPFASLDPQPLLQRFDSWHPIAYRESLCVLAASGRNITSVTAADMAHYVGQSTGHNCYWSSTDGVMAIDLRFAAQHSTAQCQHSAH